MQRITQITLPQSVVWLLAAAAVGGLTAAGDYRTVGGGMVIGLSLALAAVLVLPRWAAGTDRAFLLQVLILGFIAKMAATGFRYFVTYEVYGAQDASRYDNQGAIVAAALRSLDFSVFSYLDPGTSFQIFFTGVVYSIIGETVIGGWMVYGFLAFLGSVLFFKAFRTAFPEGRWKLFALLIFFMPSVLYWPTGIGKDAPVYLFTGVFAYGAALALKGRWGGILLVGLGLVGAFMVRPEAALVAGAAFVPAVLLRSVRGGRAKGLALLLGAAALGTAIWFTQGGAASLGLDKLATPDDALEFIESQSAKNYSGRGGSNFATTPPSDPMWLPDAFTVVLFRPWPWEAHNWQVMLQSMEGPILAVAMLFYIGAIGRGMRSVFKDPYLLLAVVFVVVAVLGLSTLGNFGILTRQRAFMFPFLYMVIAFAPALPRPGRPRASRGLADRGRLLAEGAV